MAAALEASFALEAPPAHHSLQLPQDDISVRISEPLHRTCWGIRDSGNKFGDKAAAS